MKLSDPLEDPPDLSAETRRADHIKAMSQGLMLGTVVGAIAAIGDVVLLGVALFDIRLTDRLFVGGICFGWIAAGLGLVTLWFGFGRRGLYFRIVIAGCGAFCWLASFGSGDWLLYTVLLARALLILVAAALPFALLRRMGFEFADDLEPRSFDDRTDAVRGSQFSLRNGLIWTVASALLARAAVVAQLTPRSCIALVLTPVVFSLIAIGAAGATSLERRRVWIFIAVELVCGAAMLAAREFAVYFLNLRGGSGDFIGLLLVSLVHVLTISFVLLLYRRLGYRLQRRGTTSMAPVRRQTGGKSVT